MRKSLRKFILELPGANSYCECQFPCSKIEIEHVYPKSLLKAKLDKKLFAKANQNPHNLYKCCSYLNRKKSSLLLGEPYVRDEFNGMLARACLYMDYTYNLNNTDRTISTWTNYSLLYPPFPFEYERSKKIYEYTGSSNIFIDLYMRD